LFLHASDHSLPEWVQIHTGLALTSAALVLEEAGGEVDLGATDSHNGEELN